MTLGCTSDRGLLATGPVASVASVHSVNKSGRCTDSSKTHAALQYSYGCYNIVVASHAVG